MFYLARSKLAILAIFYSLEKNSCVTKLSMCLIITYFLLLFKFCKLAIVFTRKGCLARCLLIVL